MAMYKGVKQPSDTTQPDTVVCTTQSTDFEANYQRLKHTEVLFLGDPQHIPDWEMTCVYFRDTEGNLLELSDSLTSRLLDCRKEPNT